jgi:hypothetical protein
MAKIKRPGETDTYTPPKVRKPPKRTHGTAKDHQAARRRAQQKRQQAPGADVGVGGETLDDTQLNLIAANHEDYYDTLISPFFGGTGVNPSGMSNNPYWNQYRDQAFRNAETGYTKALLSNPNLHYATYMQGLGAGGGYGQMGQLGTGAAGQIDTGNPFTSSSGIGAAPVAPTLGPKPPKKRQNALQRWRQQKKKGVGVGAAEPATLADAGVNPMASGVNYADQLRRGFLALSPLERGDAALGKTAAPGRWSPWG